MGIYLDTAISGDQQFAFSGGNEVILVAIALDPVPFNVSHPDSSAPDHLLRAGWFSIGDSLVLPSTPAEDYYREPVFFGFERLFWTPVPTGSGGPPFTLIGSFIRTHCSTGVTGRAYVFGV